MSTPIDPEFLAALGLEQSFVRSTFERLEKRKGGGAFLDNYLESLPRRFMSFSGRQAMGARERLQMTEFVLRLRNSAI